MAVLKLSHKNQSTSSFNVGINRFIDLLHVLLQFV